MKAVVLGTGGWGTALALVLLETAIRSGSGLI